MVLTLLFLLNKTNRILSLARLELLIPLLQLTVARLAEIFVPQTELIE